MKKIIFFISLSFCLIPANNLLAKSEVDCFKLYQDVFQSMIDIGLERIQAEEIAAEAAGGCSQGGGSGGI